MTAQEGHAYIDGVDGDIALLSERVDLLSAAVNSQGQVIADAAADAAAALAAVAALDTRLTAVEELLASEPWKAIPPAPTLGFASYTDADAAKWVTTHPEYSRLAGNWGGNINRTTDVVSASIPSWSDTTGWTNTMNAAIWAKCQGLLWRADDNVTRQQKAHAKIDAFAAMSKTWPTLDPDNTRLSTSWIISNLVQACWITEYPKANIESFLRWVVNYMDWWGGGNWHAGFAAVRLMVAGYLADPVMFDDAMDYFDYRIPQTLYHSQYDGANVRGVAGTSQASNPATLWPGVKNDTTLDPNATKVHWWNQTNGSNFVLISPQDGAGAERSRDLSHESMGLKSWLDAALCIKANGRTVPTHAHDRLKAHIALHSSRTLAFLQTGTTPSPFPSPAGGTGLYGGWQTSKKYLGAATPAAVNSLLQRTEITTASPTGTNQMSAEAFAEGTAY